jgi:signal transduction histidine kinase
MNRRAIAGDLEARIAIRFTALIVAVLVLGIAIYVVVDTVAAEVRLDASLGQRAEKAAQRIAMTPDQAGLSGEVRIVTVEGVVRAGEQFGDISAIGPLEGLGYVPSPGGTMRVFAVPLGDGRSVQLLDSTRPAVIDALEKALALLAIALLVGIVTYVLGLRFSKRALAPVRESIARLERFTADAGHELRTPLASVRASLDVAARTGDWAGGVERAQAELDYASTLVDRLLELARLDPSTLRLERVELAAAMARVADLCATAASERSISIATVGTVAEVAADPILLERLVTNLVMNAIRFGYGDSIVTVRFQPDAIQVHNVGDPIPPDELPRIFEPFYQSERSHASEGAGLGLAISSVIAQAHGWSLTATSSAKDGTTFTVLIRSAKGARRS